MANHLRTTTANGSVGPSGSQIVDPITANSGDTIAVLVVGISLDVSNNPSGSPPAFTVTDDGGNVYGLALAQSTGSITAAVYYAYATTGGLNVTVTYTTGSAQANVDTFASAYYDDSGLQLVLTGSDGNTGNSTSPSTPAPSLGGASSAVLVSVCGTEDGSLLSAGGSWTDQGQFFNPSPPINSSDYADIQNASSSAGGTWSGMGAAADWAAVTVAFGIPASITDSRQQRQSIGERPGSGVIDLILSSTAIGMDGSVQFLRGHSSGTPLAPTQPTPQQCHVIQESFDPTPYEE